MSFQTWNLSKNLHRQILRLKILHRQFHLISTVLMGKKHKKIVKIEKFTPLAKTLHCRRHWRHWRHWHIPPLLLTETPLTDPVLTVSKDIGQQHKPCLKCCPLCLPLHFWNRRAGARDKKGKTTLSQKALPSQYLSTLFSLSYLFSSLQDFYSINMDFHFSPDSL